MASPTQEDGFKFEPNVLPPYTFDPLLSEDDNYMLWAMIYIRSSVSRRGQMACLVVDPSTSTIIAHSNNTPLVTYATSSAVSKKSPPEIHAEARALSLIAASATQSVAGATAYITFPPCDNCFHLLAAARVRRVVFRNELRSNETKVLARALGIELVEKGTDVPQFSQDRAAQYPPGSSEVVGKAWDEWLRKRASEAWSRMGETGDVTKARNARFYKAHAEESARFTKAMLGEETDGSAEKERAMGAAGPGAEAKQTVTVVAEVEVAPAGEGDVPAKRAALRDELEEGVEPVAKVAKIEVLDPVPEPAP